jgi:cellulose synthase/poly-beta-1,6-N-acetylglucosamine synthase-like glycosyltransferase
MKTLSSCEKAHNLGQHRQYNFNGIAEKGVNSPYSQLARSHMNDFAKVSVVIPCFNCGATIGRAINSVVADSFPNREIIAVNDGSEDDTADQLTALASQYRGIVKVIHQDNRGANTARNRGLDEAT